MTMKNISIGNAHSRTLWIEFYQGRRAFPPPLPSPLIAFRYVDCEQRCAHRCPGRIAPPRRSEAMRRGIIPRRWATSVKAMLPRERRSDNRRTRGKITGAGHKPIPQSAARPIVTSAFTYRYWFIPRCSLERTHRGNGEAARENLRGIHQPR